MPFGANPTGTERNLGKDKLVRVGEPEVLQLPLRWVGRLFPESCPTFRLFDQLDQTGCCGAGELGIIDVMGQLDEFHIAMILPNGSKESIAGRRIVEGLAASPPLACR